MREANETFFCITKSRSSSSEREREQQQSIVRRNNEKLLNCSLSWNQLAMNNRKIFLSGQLRPRVRASSHEQIEFLASDDSDSIRNSIRCELCQQICWSSLKRIRWFAREAFRITAITTLARATINSEKTKILQHFFLHFYGFLVSSSHEFSIVPKRRASQLN